MPVSKNRKEHKEKSKKRKDAITAQRNLLKKRIEMYKQNNEYHETVAKNSEENVVGSDELGIDTEFSLEGFPIALNVDESSFV